MTIKLFLKVTKYYCNFTPSDISSKSCYYLATALLLPCYSPVQCPVASLGSTLRVKLFGTAIDDRTFGQRLAYHKPAFFYQDNTCLTVKIISCNDNDNDDDNFYSQFRQITNYPNIRMPVESYKKIFY